MRLLLFLCFSLQAIDLFVFTSFYPSLHLSIHLSIHLAIYKRIYPHELTPLWSSSRTTKLRKQVIPVRLPMLFCSFLFGHSRQLIHPYLHISIHSIPLSIQPAIYPHIYNTSSLAKIENNKASIATGDSPALAEALLFFPLSRFRPMNTDGGVVVILVAFSCSFSFPLDGLVSGHQYILLGGSVFRVSRMIEMKSFDESSFFG